MRHFIPVKYTSGRDSEQFMRFAVKATPTFIMLNSAGDEVDRIIGYLDAEEFVSFLDRARSKIS